MYRGKCTLTKVSGGTVCVNKNTSYECTKIPVDNPTVYSQASFDPASSCFTGGHLIHPNFINPMQQYPQPYQYYNCQPYYQFVEGITHSGYTVSYPIQKFPYYY